MEPIRFGLDIETNGFLENHLNYTETPYRLRDTFKIHCIVVIYNDKIIAFHDGPKFNFDGTEFFIDYSSIDDKYSYEFKDYEPLDYIHRPLNDFTKFVKWIPEGSTIVAHNGINFDFLAIKLYFGIDYKVEIGMDTPYGDDAWDGKHVIFDDTMVRSKCLNPDRYGGHSLMNLSYSGDTQKMEFRYHVPESVRFELFGPDMVYYNIIDVKTNLEVADKLDAEQATEWPLAKDWNPSMWEAPLKLEKQVMELITRQQHRGFMFDKVLAEKCIEELDEMMATRKEKIEAILPDRPATKGFMNDFTPPVRQLKKNREPSAYIENFAARIGADLVDTEEGWTLVYKGISHSLPMPEEPLETSMKATINDTTHIKEWLVGLGWSPLEYKEKDLTVDQKKNKLSPEKLDAVIDRYIEQTVNSNFKKDRMEFLGLSVKKNEKSEVSRVRLKAYFERRKERGGGIKVITNPSFTVGQEKELCRNLKEFAESSEELRCITDITEYLTYRHRRNSILGGGITFEDFEDEVDAQTAKGYLPNVREDGRIATPAGTCDAATSRFRHRLVVNVPRSTSLYGENMRAMFMADSNVAWQLGYDFSSLEARIEGHFCWPYEEGNEKEYCISLIQEKPHDVHCYDEMTEILTKRGWFKFGDLTEEDEVAQWDNGTITFVKPQTIVWQDYNGSMVSIENDKTSQLITPNHRVVRKSAKMCNWEVIRADELASKAKQQEIPVAGKLVCSNAEYEYEFYELLIATQADGYLARDCSAITFSFTKERKISRLTQLLDRLSAKYTITKRVRRGREETTIRLCSGKLAEKVRSVLDTGKALPYSMINLPINYLTNLVNSVGLWDGTMKNNGDIVLDTTCQQSRDVVSTMAALAGYKTSCKIYTKVTTYSPDGAAVYRVYISKKSSPVVTILSESVSTVHYVGKIGCVAVPSGVVLVRRHGKIFVSGNTVMAEKISGIVGFEFKRTPAKSVKYCATYGGQAPKVAKTIGAELAVGQQIFDAFWEAAAPLAKLKDALRRQWEKEFAKRRIIGIDGRLIPTRSAHAILNSLFQGGGVICAKKVMVYHDRLAQAEGMIVDLFTQSLEDVDSFWQQMIAYHDEAQGEVDKGSVKFKMFKTEEEAAEFKKAQKEVWSDVQHTEKGYFVAYCRQGELISEAVKLVNRDFNLNVPLDAGYVLGRTWLDCH